MIFEPRKCPIFPTFVKNGRFEYQSWIFYGSQVTRKTGEILDSLQTLKLNKILQNRYFDLIKLGF